MNPLLDVPVIVVGALVLLAAVVYGAIWSRRSERGGWLLRGLMVALLVAIALRPGWGEEPVAPTRTADLEVLVFLDRTTSMSALDWSGQRPRFAGARADLNALVDALPTGRFTVVSFGRRVRVELPSTQDETVIADYVQLLRREEAFAGDGSSLDRPLSTMASRLAELEERSPRRPRLVVLMGDGENTEAQAQRSFAAIAPLVDAGVALGYGTAAGGRMPLVEGRPEEGWVPDRRGGDAVSRIDEANLRSAAQEMGVPYLHRTGTGGLDAVAAEWVDRFQEPDPAYDGAEVPVALDLYWILALALLVLVLVDLRRHWRRGWAARRSLA
ncbi:VWA domain-containing protein [Nocardioides lijunqiniae]|uniref:VWA domain-containing protein n=1 Tax=Nocardioides lijunqiniae TaxID=2760832 RepID=UPI001877EA83|nr:VWA domain-containing protein [Nocardioides lijunqiniae]